MTPTLASLAAQLTALQEQVGVVLAEVRSLKKHKKPDHSDSETSAWIGARNLMAAFSKAFPETYTVSGKTTRWMELRAAKELLANGETIESIVELAKHNSQAEFAGYRGQSATLVLLQRNLCAIKVRKNGLIKPAVKGYTPRVAEEGEWEGEWSDNEFHPAPTRDNRQHE